MNQFELPTWPMRAFSFSLYSIGSKPI